MLILLRYECCLKVFENKLLLIIRGLFENPDFDLGWIGSEHHQLQCCQNQECKLGQAMVAMHIVRLEDMLLGEDIDEPPHLLELLLCVKSHALVFHLQLLPDVIELVIHLE